jgi:3-isopropylmalate/(R)-2-methylmalate dehydratase large subunit
VCIAAADIKPTITWGTHPGMGAAIDASVPSDDSAQSQRAREYMGFAPGESLVGHKIDVVFVGSCTNGRISDLRSAADVLRGRKVASGVRMLVVPGSDEVKRAAEAEGLDRVFREAGAEWREPGCSMCIAMNGDLVAPGQMAVSTSNRNFEGRQGKGARTVLASPATAAASAVAGVIADARTYS